MAQESDPLQRYRQLSELLFHIESQARAAHNLQELAFSLVNDTYSLLGFRQALVARLHGRKASVLAVSGLADLAEDSPYRVWLRRALPWLYAQLSTAPNTETGIEAAEKNIKGWLELSQFEDMPQWLRDGWQEWWTSGVLVVPIKDRQQRELGVLVFLLEKAPRAWHLQALDRLGATWGHAWEMLGGKAHSHRKSRLRRGRKRLLILIAIALIAAIPVRMSVLAPAEVISLSSRVVSAPLDGVIDDVHVMPNQAVGEGDALFSFDDTTLRNRLAVSRQTVAVADAEYIAASQRAFQDVQSKSELALLSSRAHEKRAELRAIQEQLARVKVKAPRAGVVVFADTDDWLGRPVSTGERIMLLANPDELGFRIHVSVSDAISLDIGAPVRLFLKTRPLQPLGGGVIESSYQAVVSPEGIASYRLRAAFDEDADISQARIGLQGTAKVYGQRVTLGYYVLRRPLASLREWVGW